MDLNKMNSLAGLGRMRRRDFIQLGLAAGLSVALADGMFARAAKAQAKRGGKLRIGIGAGSTTDSLDPATYTNAFMGDVGEGFIGATLTRIDQQNLTQPHLAESFEPSDGARKWVFKLRNGLTFHDGRDLTAKDVVATYEYHRSEKAKSAARSILTNVASVTADDPQTVVFTLTSGNADFPFIVSDYHLPIFPAKDGGGIDWEKGNMAGPFIIEEFKPGVSMRAKRFPNYHVTGLPYFDEVELLAIADVGARTNAFVAGEIDYMDRVDLRTIDMLKQNPDIEITNLPAFAHYVAPMNVTVAPFDNLDVRTAIKWAIDREAIVKQVLNGYGLAGNDNPIAPSIQFATNPAPVFKYDPDKAKFHLKKAGFETIKIDFSASDAGFPGAVDAGLLMQSQAKAAGIDINVVREPADGYWDNVYMKKPWCASYWGGRPTIDWMLATAYTSDAVFNDTFWKNPKFDQLLAAARAETDNAKRAAQYAEAQQILHDDGGIVVLMFANWVSANSKKLAHGPLNVNYDHDGCYIYERWWFA
jgi:peptide/nickel transport system substrate-binding protein